MNTTPTTPTKRIAEIPAAALHSCPASGHTHPGDPATLRGKNRTQRGFWGQAPGPSGYYTAWVEFDGVIYLTPDGIKYGHGTPTE